MKFTVLFVLALAFLACSGVVAQQQDQVEAGEKHTNAALKELHDITGGRPMTASEKKIRTLTAPKIEYYHEVQKTNDREVDLTARAIIDNPQRQAWRKRVADQKVFVKTVNEATALLNAHNKLPALKVPKSMM